MCFVQTVQRVKVNCASEGQRGFYERAARGQNKFRHSCRSRTARRHLITSKVCERVKHGTPILTLWGKVSASPADGHDEIIERRALSFFSRLSLFVRPSNPRGRCRSCSEKREHLHRQ